MGHPNLYWTLIDKESLTLLLGDAMVPNGVSFTVIGPTVIHNKFANLKKERAVFGDMLEEQGTQNVNPAFSASDGRVK